MKKLIISLLSISIGTIAMAQDQYAQQRPVRLAAVINDTVLADSNKHAVVRAAVKEFAVLPDTPDGDKIAEAQIKNDVYQVKGKTEEKKGIAQYSFLKAYGGTEPSVVAQEADVAKFAKTLTNGGIKPNEFKVIRYKGNVLDYFPDLEPVPAKEIEEPK